MHDLSTTGLEVDETPQFKLPFGLLSIPSGFNISTAEQIEELLTF